MFVMITETQLVEVIKEAKTTTKPKKFTQAIELIINFKDIDVKKGLPSTKWFSSQRQILQQLFVLWLQETWAWKQNRQMLMPLSEQMN